MTPSASTFLAALLLLASPGLALAQAPVAPAAPADGAADEPRRLVLMVQYIGTDWPGAVVDGKVVNQVEYDEAVQNANDALARYARLSRSGALKPSLEKLKRLVDGKASKEEIAAEVRALVPALSTELGVVPFPSSLPDLKKGALVYQMACMNCHGAAGDGDGPAGKGMTPPPTVFSNAAWADQAAPFQLFNTVTLGIPGTGMGAFGAQLPEDLRWAVAFYLLTLRRPASPPKADPRITLTELATLSNAQIADRLVKSDSALTPQAALDLVDAARREMPKALTPDLAMEAIIKAVARAAQLAKTGDKAGAADVVSAAYFDAVEPVEPQLRERFSPQVLALEASITALRKAITDGGDVDAAANTVSARAMDIKSGWSAQAQGGRYAPRGKGPPWGIIAGVSGAALAVLVGIFLTARRRRA